MTQPIKITEFSSLLGDMGLDYLKALSSTRILEKSELPRLVFPRGASRIVCDNPKVSRHKYSVTGTQFLYVPPGLPLQITTSSAMYDVIILVPCQKYMSELIDENKLPDDAAKKLTAEVILLKRSRWIDDLIERYFFERVENSHSPKGCPFFLEKQMLNEFARLAFPKVLMTTGSILGQEPLPMVESIVRHIDQEIFQGVSVETLCEKFKMSSSTLLRLFRQNFGQTPAAFLQERRLDEAAIMLERGDFTVSDICYIAGFSELSSFNRAFKKRFSQSPSEYRTRSLSPTE